MPWLTYMDTKRRNVVRQRRAVDSAMEHRILDAAVKKDSEQSAEYREKREKAQDEAIRVRAYSEWETAGCPEGDGLEFWLQAEQEMRGYDNYHVRERVASQ
jgi:hypothetical protein